MSRTQIRLMTAFTVLSLATQLPAFAAGFALYEHGSEAMGMAGAFTAQADDGSAMFHNIAGLGFIKEKRLEAGVTIITLDKATFEGLNPFPGTDARAEMNDLTFFPPHAYYIRPVNDRWTFGFGANSPFGLKTSWQDNDNFPGRFISLEAELRSVDLNAGLGWQAADRFSLGVSVIARNSELALKRRVPFLIPFTQTVTDIAEANLQSDLELAFGWTFGALHRVTDYFSWGFSYRSKIKTDYSGDGDFRQISTGIPALDAVVSGRLPFDAPVPLQTSVEFPDMAFLGFAFGLTQKLLVEIDVGWTGWSTFDEIILDFPQNPELSSVIPEHYEDVYNYRLGVSYDIGSKNELRFGYVFDETPQPDAAVGPLLPDGDRTGFTVGYGWGDRFDAALMILSLDERTTTTNEDGFFGTYGTDVYLLGLTYKL